jgi:hypothetical protein
MTRSGVMPNLAARTVPFPTQSSWPRVRVGVDREQAAHLGGQAQQRVRRVHPLRAAVDLDRDTVLPARSEHRLRVEHRLRALAASAGQPAGAVAQHVQVRVTDRGHHPLGHRLGGHPQQGMDAGHHQVQPGQQVLPLIQRAVFQDVDLDPGQDPERRQPGVQLADQLELASRRSADSPCATVSRGE